MGEFYDEVIVLSAKMSKELREKKIENLKCEIKKSAENGYSRLSVKCEDKNILKYFSDEGFKVIKQHENWVTISWSLNEETPDFEYDEDEV